MRKNNSESKPYYTQRNNKIKPSGACNVTAMVAALSASGWPVDKLAEQKTQPEDSLMKFIINDPVCTAMWKKCDPRGQFAPNEWHAILARGVNRWVARTFPDAGVVVRFTEETSISEIALYVENGGNVVASGTFPADGVTLFKPLNHIFAIVGTDRTDEKVLSAFIIDDSWGNYHVGYKDHDGNDINMPVSEFKSIAKFCGSDRKMAHFVRRYQDEKCS